MCVAEKTLFMLMDVLCMCVCVSEFVCGVCVCVSGGLFV